MIQFCRIKLCDDPEMIDIYTFVEHRRNGSNFNQFPAKNDFMVPLLRH